MIFLDMDGVLCDFASAAFAVHGRMYVPSEYPACRWDIASVIGVSTEVFWQKIHQQGESFWEELEPYPWTMDLVRELRNLDRVVIATSPSRCPTSYAGKRRWLIRHGLGDMDAMFGSQKWLMAKPGRWLIDDNPDNLTSWVEAGGNGYCVPQPWNKVLPKVDGLVNDLSRVIRTVREYETQ